MAITYQDYMQQIQAQGISHEEAIRRIKLHRERTGDSLYEALVAVAEGRLSERLSYRELVKHLETAIAWIEEEPNEYKPTAQEILPQLREALAKAKL